MKHIHADDGRILTSPKELKPLLKGAFTAFSKLIGHIRFFYMADEIWDGKSSLVFSAGGVQLSAVALNNGFFNIHIGAEDFRIADETLLDIIFEKLKKTVPHEQRDKGTL
ncbi:MAG: hypothetical protein LBU32_18190 [Clostridiales bacterium]|nr:hypothetical protein [Clostridiales bacterium]